MSGHSKWSTIRRQKETVDLRRGLLFSKLARSITIVAREGTNPDTNFKLRLAVEKARAANMPKENIERAIRAAGGKLAVQEVQYEGYGPGGVAVVVRSVTDNKNRTAQEIKNLFERGGGRLGGPGSVAFQFELVGQFVVQKTASPDEQMLTLIDAGVEDIDETEDGIEAYVKPNELSAVQDKITNLGFTVTSSEMALRPKTLATISDPQEAKRAISFLQSLQSHDDVQAVFANLNIPQEIMSKIAA